MCIRDRPKLERVLRSIATVLEIELSEIALVSNTEVPFVPTGAPSTQTGQEKTWTRWRWGWTATAAATVISAAIFAFIFWENSHTAKPPTSSTADIEAIDSLGAVEGIYIHYGSVVRGHVSKADGRLYLLVLDSGGLRYYAQLDRGSAPITICPDGSWERQVWPGTPAAGDGQYFTLLLVLISKDLPKEFLDPDVGFRREDLPRDAVKQRVLRVRRVPPSIDKTHFSTCKAG